MHSDLFIHILRLELVKITNFAYLIHLFLFIIVSLYIQSNLSGLFAFFSPNDNNVMILELAQQIRQLTFVILIFMTISCLRFLI